MFAMNTTAVDWLLTWHGSFPEPRPMVEQKVMICFTLTSLKLAEEAWGTNLVVGQLEWRK